jgi:membrane protein implicated in regulation of membrane protease activity
MEWLYVRTSIEFAKLVASVRQDWVWWAVAGVLAVLGLMVYSALALTASYRRLARLERTTREYLEQEIRSAGEHRQEIIERLRAAHYYLRELDEKLGSSLPRDVQVGSIKAENLVVQPGGIERPRESR